MTFRGDDEAREERARALEKQLEDARRELSELRPKAAGLDIAEKENKRLVAEIASLRGTAAPSRSKTPLVALVALVGLLVASLVAWIAAAPDAPPREPDWAARESELEARVAQHEAQVAADRARLEREEDARRDEAARAAAFAVPSDVDPLDEPGEHPTPTRAEVLDAMNVVRPAVEACEEGSRQVAVRVTFVSSGAASVVEVRDEIDAPIAACIARAVRAARVPAFSRASFVVSYPFRT